MARPRIHLLFAELRVRNLERSVRFYRMLGLEIKSRGSLKDGTRFVWLWDKRTRQLVELWQFGRRSVLKTPFDRVSGFDHGLAFSTVDAAPLIRKLRTQGGRAGKSVDVGGVLLTLVKDPDGHVLEILSRPPGSYDRRSKPPFLRLATSNKPL